MVEYSALPPMVPVPAGRAGDRPRLAALLAEEARRVAEEHAAWARDRQRGEPE